MVDIIIPIYNIDINQLKTCLLSITAQTFLEKIKITIVDDGSSKINKDFNVLLDQIRTFVPIQLLRYEKNRGPGYARQYGIDHTDNEYIMFIDADDMFMPITVETLYKALQDYPDKPIAVAEFYALDSEDRNLRLVQSQLTWVFSKMYRRSIIEQYNFKFNIEEDCSYANEDVGFNVQYQYLFGDSCVVLIKCPLYYWTDNNKTSITRNNNGEYAYKQGHKGYIMNFIRTYDRMHNEVSKEKNTSYAFKHLFDIYKDYSKNWIAIKENNLTEELFSYSRLYYDKVFKNFDTDDKEVLKKQFNIYCKNWQKSFDHFLMYLLKLRENN